MAERRDIVGARARLPEDLDVVVHLEASRFIPMQFSDKGLPSKAQAVSTDIWFDQEAQRREALKERQGGPPSAAG